MSGISKAKTVVAKTQQPVSQQVVSKVSVPVRKVQVPAPIIEPPVVEEIVEEVIEVEETDETLTPSEAGTVDETTSKRRRKIVTVEDHIANYNELLTYVNNEISRKKKEKETGVRALNYILKHLTSMKKEVPQLFKKPKKEHIHIEGVPPKENNLTKPIEICDELADFLQLEHGSKLTRSQVTSAIYAYCFFDESKATAKPWEYLNPERRDLRDPNKKSIIIPDEALNRLLRYDEYCEQVANGSQLVKSKNKETGKSDLVKVVDNSLKFWVISRLITPLFNNKK